MGSGGSHQGTYGRSAANWAEPRRNRGRVFRYLGLLLVVGVVLLAMAAPAYASAGWLTSDSGGTVERVQATGAILDSDATHLSFVSDELYRVDRLGELELMSQSWLGDPLDHGVSGGQVSADGSWAAFGSDSTNVTMYGNEGGLCQIWLCSNDPDHHEHLLASHSVGNPTQPCNGYSEFVDLSADGKRVLFASYATDLVSNSTTGAWNLFVYDADTGLVTQVNVNSDGVEANDFCSSGEAAISGNGQWVVFPSFATNLVSDDTNGCQDIFLRSLQSGTTTRVGRGLGASFVEPNGGAERPSISYYGTYVSFDSFSDNLADDDLNYVRDVFVWRSWDGAVTRVTMEDDPRYAADDTHQAAASLSSDLSADGQKVVFLSAPGAQQMESKNWDVLVRTVATGQTVQADVDDAGLRLTDTVFVAPRISPNGRYVTYGPGWWVDFDVVALGVQIADAGGGITPPWLAGDRDKDTDGDALPDYWELTGDTDEDGIRPSDPGGDPGDVNLPAMGADPYKKDIFVEIDWMKYAPDPLDQLLNELLRKIFPWLPRLDEAHEHTPDLVALREVVESFSRRGINLHIDAGPESPLDLQQPYGQKWGSLGRGEAFDEDPWRDIEAAGGGDAIIDIEAAHFDLARKGIFHYCIYGHEATSTGNAGCAWFKDSWVVAQMRNNNATIEACTFMHELGHNLNLGHGGPGEGPQADLNHKPNYLSIMNYTYCLSGLLYNAAARANERLIDYSESELDPLYEDGLYEMVGITPFELMRGLKVKYYVLPVWNAQKNEWTWTEREVGGLEVNWNEDLLISPGPVVANINRDYVKDANQEYVLDENGNLISVISELRGWDDWQNLDFSGLGWIGPSASLPHPEMTPHFEATHEEFAAWGLDHGPYSVSVSGSDDVARNPIVTVCPGWRSTVPLTIRNFGDLADSYDVVVTSSSPVVDVSGVPETLSLEPGETYELELGLDVPLDQLDGPLGEVEVVVASQLSNANVARCTVKVECAKLAAADLPDLLDLLSAPLRDSAEHYPLVSDELASAADDVEAALSALAESPADRAAAVSSLNEALLSLWQAIDALALADAQSGTPTYAGAIEGLKNYSTLLVRVAQNEAEQAIDEAEAAGEDPAVIAAAHAHLADGDAAYAQGDHLAAVAQYLDAANLEVGDENQAPEVEIAPTGAANEGSVFSGSGFFTDPDSPSFTATIDYGDGSGVRPLTLNPDKTFSLSHTYADNGTYTLTVAVTDNNSATGSATSTVTVANVAPTLGPLMLPPGSQAPNATVTASATFTDPGTFDTHTATWDWGDGTTSAGTVIETDGSGSVAASHAYPSPGSYTITLTVTDKDQGSASASATQQVAELGLGVALYTGGNASFTGSCKVGSPLVSGEPSAAAYVSGTLTTSGSVSISRIALLVGSQGATVPALSEFMPDALVASLIADSQAARPVGATYGNLSYSGHTNAIFTAPITINGNLTISGSSTYRFDSVYVTGNVSISGSATVSFASLRVGGTLTVSGSGSRTLGPTYVAGNVTVSGSGQLNAGLLVTAGTLGITGSLTIGGDGVGSHPGPVRLLVVGAGKAVTMSGGSAFYGQLYNQSGSITRSGSGVIRGSVLCGGSYTSSGSCDLEYDQGVLGRLD